MDQKPAKRFLTAAFVITLNLLSQTRADMAFPAKLSVQDLQLNLCSTAKLKAFRFVSVGDAALYLSDCAQLPDILSATPKYLRFAYDTEIPAKAFQEASVEYLKINLGSKFAQWQPEFQQFNKQYQDIKAGDYYDLIYSPSSGLQLQLNGKSLATIKKPDIALAYLQVWFGQEPFSADLKAALLKQAGD